MHRKPWKQVRQAFWWRGQHHRRGLAMRFLLAATSGNLSHQWSPDACSCSKDSRSPWVVGASFELPRGLCFGRLSLEAPLGESPVIACTPSDTTVGCQCKQRVASACQALPRVKEVPA